MPDFNVLTTTRYGPFLYNRNDAYIGRALEVYGESGEMELALLRQVCGAGSVVFDVGANIGDHAVPLARHVAPSGFVFAFEPVRLIFQTLCANVALNSLLNVECVHAAAGERSGTVLVPEIEYESAGNFGALSLDGSTRGRPVQCVTLDDYVQLVARADLIKIDVEGMELPVLRGGSTMINRFRPVLYVENDRPERSPALIEHLWELDYRLYWHQPPLYNPANFRGVAEDLFAKVVACNMFCLPREREARMEGFLEVCDAREHPKNC